MSDKLPVESTKTEELDLVILFKLIGKSFRKLGELLLTIGKGLLGLLIFALKPVVANIRLISIILLITITIGFIVEKFKTPVYFSEMLVQPHFESKYKLSNNINYFNALIRSKKIDELSKIFEVDSVQAASLIDFELNIGPETANSLLQQYDAYIKTIDSSLAAQVSFDDYIENRDILSADVFAVKARSIDNNIFIKLETGFSKTFENPYSKKLKKIRDSTIQIKKEAYSKELNRLDSLQRVYFELIKVETENNSFTIGQQGTFPLQLERTPTREYDLFQEELRVRRLIRELDEKMIEESVFYDVIASFEEEGTLEEDLVKNYIFILPLGTLALLTFVYVFIGIFNFIKNYEA